MGPLTSLFFSKFVLASRSPLKLSMNDRVFFHFCKNVTDILMAITLNLYIALGNIITRTILSLPTHEHGVSFGSLRSPFISFSSVLWFPARKSHVWLNLPLFYFFSCYYK